MSIRGVFVSFGVLGFVGAAGNACLSRPVEGNPPTTKTNFTSKVKQQAVDKIDLLLAIDNSQSMGDKQKFLATAVPNLVKRLVTPNCVAADGKPNGVTSGANEDPSGQFGCTPGTKPEFKPIVDIHIAVITSSLGAFGGTDQCVTSTDNDFARPINRSSVTPIEPAAFLAWYPESNRHGTNAAPAAAYKSDTELAKAVQGLVTGSGENGCGLEAQLESVYHFLVQPDPYESVSSEGGRGSYRGVDNALVAARHDFLRPDSLVAVVMLTDEDDSSVDPLSVGGNGYRYMQKGGVPRPTAACSADPSSKDCAPCSTSRASDPNCKVIEYGVDDDPANVRFFHMKQRYGADPQYPIRRYVNGFQSRSVPSRSAEHDANGNYLENNNNCTNPLFARELPKALTEGKDDKGQVVYLTDLKDTATGKPLSACALPRGDRDESLVFFAVIGGVPNELLHFDPADPEKSRLTDTDWVKILGKDPSRFDYSGIDARMVQSIEPRAERPGPNSPDSPPDDSLNKQHRDWDTKKRDLQFACTFPIPAADQRAFNPNDQAADCADGSTAPLCGGPGTSRKQVRAKAFPTIREFSVVRALGDQGIAASLCPQETASPTSPLYGYNPAVKTIVDRLANAISRQCLPRPLTKDSKGEVSCLMLAVLPDKNDKCSAHTGYSEISGDILANFRKTQRETGEADKVALPVCKIAQVKVENKGEGCDGTSSDRNKGTGWCYVTNDPASKRCPQAIEFSPDAIVNGSTVALQCIDQTGGATAP
jgi:hypothetical protein